MKDRELPFDLGRRAFLHNGTLILTATALGGSSFGDDQRDADFRLGLVTDLHYADKPPAGSRHYRETPEKLAEAAGEFGRQQLAFVIELGDLIDAAESVDTEMGYLQRINRDFASVCQQRHYVLGNHCVYTLTKQEFLEGVEQRHSYYSFDYADFHFVVLDSCFRSDGTPYGRRNFEWTDANIPAAELEWLKEDLKDADKKTVVFAHQRLDITDHYTVKNAADVRHVLKVSEKVAAVLQGHSHQNDYQEIDGIHYCTLAAMIEGSGVENNAYSIMRLTSDGTIRISGFRRQNHYEWS